MAQSRFSKFRYFLTFGTLLLLMIGCARSHSPSKNAVAPTSIPNSLPTSQPAEPLIGPFKLRSTVYFLAKESDSPSYLRCAPAERMAFRDRRGDVLATACPVYFRRVAMEGSGLVTHNGREYLINFAGRKYGSNYYMRVDRSICPWGVGQENLCLQPFMSIAADPRFYRSGDIIFVPAIAARKLRLPNGQIHPGYFMVSDTGSAIRGLGRFDFFTGAYDAFAKDNPFRRLNLTSSANGFEFYVVKRGSRLSGRLLSSYFSPTTL